MRSAFRIALPLLIATRGLAQDAPVPRIEPARTVQAPAGPGDLYREKSLSGRATAAEGKSFVVGAGRYDFSAG